MYFYCLFYFPGAKVLLFIRLLLIQIMVLLTQITEAYWLDEVHNGEESQMQMRKTMPISWTNALLLLFLRKMPIRKITEFFE
jgi:hypothetical protein